MKLTGESKFFLGVTLGTILLVIVGVLFLSRPATPIDKSILISESTHTFGNPNAEVWLVEFSDFECPACRVFAKTVEDLMKTHKDSLLFAHRHFPLPQHAFSMKTAIAAEAAGKQGNFWEMTSVLYGLTPLSDETIAKSAGTIHLDEARFASDSADPTLRTVVETDRSLGDSLGVNATPTFYLNGIRLNVGSPEELKQKVEAALKK